MILQCQEWPKLHLRSHLAFPLGMSVAASPRHDHDAKHHTRNYKRNNSANNFYYNTCHNNNNNASEHNDDNASHQPNPASM